MSSRCYLAWISLILYVSILFGCSKTEVDPIHYGSDYCDHCKMQITDKRFGGVILTKAGKSLKYDSIECLAHGNHEHKVEVQEIFLVDYDTQKLTTLEKLGLYRNEAVRGPMGTHLQALSTNSSLPKVRLEEIPK